MTEELTNDLPQWGALLGEPTEVAAQADAAPDPALPGQPADSPAELAAPAEPAEPAPAGPPFRITVSALTDIGCVRSNNEDFFGYDESLGIFVVCDGMGGMASGEVASSRTVAAVIHSYAASAASGLSVSSRLLHAINTANLDVWENGQIPETKAWEPPWWRRRARSRQAHPRQRRRQPRLYPPGRPCAQLTVDHSYVNELFATAR
jgi:hypothetical protein